MTPARPTFLIVAVLAVLLWSGCESEVATPRLSSFETYYPLELNRSVYYQVDSVVLYATVGGIRYDSSQTEARETLLETFTGADGQTVYRGERWERKDDSQPFRYKKTFTVGRNGGVVTRSEDNLTFTKMVQPIREGVSWKGNKAFDGTNLEVPVGGEFVTVYRYWDYKYRSVDSSVVLTNGVSLDSVVTIQQADVTDNFIEYRVAYERYAAGIGLVERFLDARDTQCIVCCNRDSRCNTLPWDEKAEQGYIIRETYLRRD